MKLIDFGFSKQLKDIKKDSLVTQCGTPTYTAPEVMMGAKYNYKADLWSLGILICELVGGFTPFSRQMSNKYDEGADPGVGLSPIKMIELANSGSISLPRSLDKVTRDLILKLLVPDPNQRLELAEVKSHRFFKPIDWSKAAARQLEPPYIPDEISYKETNAQPDLTRKESRK